MELTRRDVLASVTAGSALLAGCSGADDGGATTPTPTATDADTGTPSDGVATTVELASSTFDPVRATVEPGTTVEWVNRDGYAHDVTSAQFHDSAASWDYSAELPAQGDTATQTFAESGVYEYYCTIHGRSTMCGVVLVGDVSLDADLPCEGGGGGGGPY